MNVTEPVSRKLLHSRRISCDGYQREDGLWDIEAELVDTRSYDLPRFFELDLPAGEVLHGMGFRITVDADMVIRQVEASTRHGPVPDCRDIAATYGQLVGLTIGQGFSAAIKKLFGGRRGCTHLTELLIPMATTAYQTIWRQSWETVREQNETGERPPLLDSCHSYRSDGEVIRVFWPKFYSAR